MTVITAHAAGTFCWPELATTDVAAAVAFYSAIFGWDGDDQPTPAGEPYTMLKLAGREVGALHPMQPGPRAAGVPPHWMSYVAVVNADDAARTAAGLGGTVIAPPFDVMDAGRMAVLQDPTGAVFSVWQARSHPGAGRINEVGALCWTELYTPDTEKAGAFYAALFNWHPKPWDGPTEYTVFNVANQDRLAGGMLPMPEDMQQRGTPPHWLPYFQVADTDRTAALASERRGTIVYPPTEIPHIGRFAILRDPQGATFAVIKMA